jgi:hypothetical protein
MPNFSELAKTATSAGQPCYLLKLPTELQLDIYELVVVEDQPLLVNCPCNSSYRGRWEEGQTEEQRWEKGEIRPPQQPALTRTCRAVRENALPIFYKENIFRASYCNATVSDLSAPIQWFRMIGQSNREMLRHFYFYDRNERQDHNRKSSLQRLKDCEVFGVLGGNMETLSSVYCCAHLVTFGERERKAKEIPIASEKEVPRLRMAGER